MDWETVWAVLYSPVVISAIAAGVVLGLAKLYAVKPDWRKYEGTIISGVKAAEKAIPNDTPNKALARADAALRYVLEVWEKVEGKAPDKATVADLAQGIAIVHADLEAKEGI